MTANPQLLEQARAALIESDKEKAESLYFELIAAIESVYGKNQKDIANELQRMAKNIEETDNLELAMEFKQRTCEALLKIGMAERQRNRQLAPQAQPQVVISPEPVKFFQRSDILLLAAANFDLQFIFFKNNSNAKLVHSLKTKDTRIAIFDLGLFYKIMLFSSQQISGFLPLFLADKLEDCKEHLCSQGFTVDSLSLSLADETLTVLRDPSGNPYVLARSGCLKSLKLS